MTSTYDKQYFINALSNKGCKDVEVYQETPNHVLFVCKIDLGYKLFLGIVNDPVITELFSSPSKETLLDETQECFKIEQEGTS